MSHRSVQSLCVGIWRHCFVQPSNGGRGEEGLRCLVLAYSVVVKVEVFARAESTFRYDLERCFQLVL